MQAAAIYARDSLSGPANIFGRALTTGSTIEDVENWPQSIEAVTAGQVNEAARTYLDFYNPDDPAFVTGYLLPEVEE